MIFVKYIFKLVLFLLFLLANVTRSFATDDIEKVNRILRPDSYIYDTANIFKNNSNSYLDLSLKLSELKKSNGIYVYLVTYDKDLYIKNNHKDNVQEIQRDLSIELIKTWLNKDMGVLIIYEEKTGELSVSTSFHFENEMLNNKLKGKFRNVMKNALMSSYNMKMNYSEEDDVISVELLFSFVDHFINQTKRINFDEIKNQYFLKQIINMESLMVYQTEDFNKNNNRLGENKMVNYSIKESEINYDKKNSQKNPLTRNIFFIIISVFIMVFVIFVFWLRSISKDFKI